MGARYPGVEVADRRSGLVGWLEPIGQVLDVFGLLLDGEILDRVDELWSTDLRDWHGRERKHLELVPG